MTVANTIDYRTIGPYTAGEKPPVISVDFWESSPADLTGWTLAVRCERDGVELSSWGSVAWSNAAIARANLTMPELALATGISRSVFVVQVWAGNSTQRFASPPIMFYVVKQIGTVPTV
jgi:hypothetical protein